MFNQPRNSYRYRFLLAMMLMSISMLGNLTLSVAPVHAGDVVPLKGRFADADFSGNFTHRGFPL